MGRENVLTYGKITLVSSGENVEKLMVYLDRIIQKHGYPDAPTEHEIEDDEEFEEVEAELAPDEGEDDSDEEEVESVPWRPNADEE
jgi:hypothetical protein